jgi:hypothetical protein
MAAATAVWPEAALLAVSDQPPRAAAQAAPLWLLEPACCCSPELLACSWTQPAWVQQDSAHSAAAHSERTELQAVCIGSRTPTHLCSHRVDCKAPCAAHQQAVTLGGAAGGGGGGRRLAWGCAARHVGPATPRCCTGRAWLAVGAGVSPLPRAPGILVDTTCMGASVWPYSICAQVVVQVAHNLHWHRHQDVTMPLRTSVGLRSTMCCMLWQMFAWLSVTLGGRGGGGCGGRCRGGTACTVGVATARSCRGRASMSVAASLSLSDLLGLPVDATCITTGKRHSSRMRVGCDAKVSAQAAAP